MQQGFFLNSDSERTAMVAYTFLKAIKGLLTRVKATPGYIDYQVSINDVSRGIKILVQSNKETLYGKVLSYDCLKKEFCGYFDVEDCIYALVKCFNDLGYNPSRIEIFTEGFTIKEVRLDSKRITPSKIFL